MRLDMHSDLCERPLKMKIWRLTTSAVCLDMDMCIYMRLDMGMCLDMDMCIDVCLDILLGGACGHVAIGISCFRVLF